MPSWSVSSRAATAGLLGLVVLDVVLVAAAFRSTDASSIDRSPLKTASSGTDPVRGTASGSPTPSVTSPGGATTMRTTGTAPRVAPLRTMLVAVDNKLAWRVGTGSCTEGGATLTLTSDGGRTWAEGTTPLPRIVRVQPAAAGVAFVIGASSSCTATLMSTADGGGTWGPASSVEGVWFRDPEDAKVVGVPGLSTARPCGIRAVLDLAAVSPDSARVLCSDGMTRQTADTGSSWVDLGKVTGAVALAVDMSRPQLTYVAGIDAARCSGIQIQRLDERAATSCVESVIPADPGQIALSLVNGDGWLAVGDTTMRSTDDLRSWHVS